MRRLRRALEGSSSCSLPRESSSTAHAFSWSRHRRDPRPPRCDLALRLLARASARRQAVRMVPSTATCRRRSVRKAAMRVSCVRIASAIRCLGEVLMSSARQTHRASVRPAHHPAGDGFRPRVTLLEFGVREAHTLYPLSRLGAPPGPPIRIHGVGTGSASFPPIRGWRGVEDLRGSERSFRANLAIMLLRWSHAALRARHGPYSHRLLHLFRATQGSFRRSGERAGLMVEL